MDALVYPRERTLGTITLVLGSIAWLLIVVGTLGIVLIYLLLGFIAYLFAQSGLISYIKNTAVRLTPQQFPDLRARFLDCCKKLQIETPPEAYVLAGNGLLNAQLILIAVIGVLAAVALPAYRDYQQRAQVAEAWLAGDSARNALARFYETKGRAPESLQEAGVPARLANGAELTLDSDSMTLTLALTQGGELLMAPKVDAQNRVRWFCSVGEGLSPKALPRHCQTGGAR